MEFKNTFGLFFYLKKTRVNKKGEVPIYFRITVNGVRTALSLQKSVKLNLWDTNLGLVKANTQYAKNINREIKLVEGKILEYSNNLSSINTLSSVSNNQFLNETNYCNTIGIM